MTIRSHFVPQFYLRNFGDQLYFYDKTTGDIKESNPANIALKKDFYGPTDENKSNTVETSMSQLEGSANTVIRKIIDTLDYAKLSEKEKFDFCSFVALQYLRTQEARVRIIQTANKFFDEIAKRKGVTDAEIKHTKEGEMGATP